VTLRRSGSGTKWTLLLCLLLMASAGFNGWLTLRVLDYKGRLLLAKEFPDQAPHFVEKDARLLVWMAGDSRVVSWNFPETPGRRVVNRGVSGFTVRETLDRFRADTTAGSRPDVVVIQAGINDVLSAGYNRPSRLPPASPPRPSPEDIMKQCAADMEKLLAAARGAGAEVILCTVFPPGPYGLRDRFFWTSGLEGRIVDLNAALRRAAGPGIHLLDAAALLAPEGRTKDAYSEDALHLNSSGYGVLTEALEAALAARAR